MANEAYKAWLDTMPIDDVHHKTERLEHKLSDLRVLERLYAERQPASPEASDAEAPPSRRGPPTTTSPSRGLPNSAVGGLLEAGVRPADTAGMTDRELRRIDGVGPGAPTPQHLLRGGNTMSDQPVLGRAGVWRRPRR